jgi:hypothetical protein
MTLINDGDGGGSDTSQNDAVEDCSWGGCFLKATLALII